MLPVVEMSAGKASLKTCDSLLMSLQRFGFAYIRCPWLPKEFIAEVKQSGRWLHGLDASTKASLATGHDFRGYYQYVGESGASDSINCFSIGADVSRPLELRQPYLDIRQLSDPQLIARASQMNAWPDAGISGAVEFRSTMTRYYAACHELSMATLRHVSVGLGIRDSDSGEPLEEFFTGAHSKKDCNLEIKHYPSLGDAELVQFGKNRLAPHKDLSSLTVLAQDNIGGLEVFNKETEMFDAVPVLEDAVLINAGVFLERWTDGVIDATLHRVANCATSTPGGRLSCVFFCFPDHDARIVPLSANGEDEAFLAGDMMPTV